MFLWRILSKTNDFTVGVVFFCRPSVRREVLTEIFGDENFMIFHSQKFRLFHLISFSLQKNERYSIIEIPLISLNSKKIFYFYIEK